MISTEDTNSKKQTAFAGLSVVLHPSESSSAPTPLTEWLSEIDIAPIWIPLRKADGVTKIMPVLPEAQSYPNLMQAICQQIGENSSVEWREKPYNIGGVEVNSHSLHTVEINISTFKPFPPTLGRAIHALCFRWFANTSPELAEKVTSAGKLTDDFGTKILLPQTNAVEN